MDIIIFIMFVLLLIMLVANISFGKAVVTRFRKVEIRQDRLDEGLTHMVNEVRDRHIAMSSVIHTSVRDAMTPINERLDNQDQDLREIKDVCMFLAGKNSDGSS